MTYEKEIKLIAEVIKLHTLHYLTDSNIISVGISYKKDEKIKDSKLAIRFKVFDSKRSELPTSIQHEGHSISTFTVSDHKKKSVIRKGIINRAERADLLQPGLVIGHINKNDGVTLGAIAKIDGEDYGITCNHGFTRIGKYRSITQPNNILRDKNNVIGEIAYSDNHLDCAFIKLDKNKRNYDSKVLGIGIKASKVGSPKLGEKVIISGGKTEIAHGIVSVINIWTKPNDIDAIGFEVRVNPEMQNQNCELAQMGDSGAGWYYYNIKKELVFAGIQILSGSSSEHNCDTEFAFVHLSERIFSKFNFNYKNNMEYYKPHTYVKKGADFDDDGNPKTCHLSILVMPEDGQVYKEKTDPVLYNKPHPVAGRKEIVTFVLLEFIIKAGVTYQKPLEIKIPILKDRIGNDKMIYVKVEHEHLDGGYLNSHGGSSTIHYPDIDD